MKACFKCGAEKPLSEYYKGIRMSDGHMGACKGCVKKGVRQNRSKRADYYREYDRKRSYLKHRVAARKEYKKDKKENSPKYWQKMRYEANKKYRENNGDKAIAWSRLWCEIRKGNIELCPCIVCGSSKTEAHHPDYSYPLSVIWYCDKHHKEEHVRLREEERNG